MLKTNSGCRHEQRTETCRTLSWSPTIRSVQPSSVCLPSVVVWYRLQPRPRFEWHAWLNVCPQTQQIPLIIRSSFNSSTIVGQICLDSEEGLQAGSQNSCCTSCSCSPLRGGSRQTLQCTTACRSSTDGGFSKASPTWKATEAPQQPLQPLSVMRSRYSHLQARA